MVITHGGISLSVRYVIRGASQFESKGQRDGCMPATACPPLQAVLRRGRQSLCARADAQVRHHLPREPGGPGGAQAQGQDRARAGGQVRAVRARGRPWGAARPARRHRGPQHGAHPGFAHPLKCMHLFSSTHCRRPYRTPTVCTRGRDRKRAHALCSWRGGMKEDPE